MGILSQFVQLYVSIRDRHVLRDYTGDPWNGRTLEWSVSSPAPFYNFAVTPTVSALDQFWVDKSVHHVREWPNQKDIHYHAIHMPSNTPTGFIIAIFAGITGFALVWHMWIPGIIGCLGMFFTMIAQTFLPDTGYYVDVNEIKQTELAHYLERT
jgi:cytochrome o ubiquinol oxidase subunit 1